MLEAAPSRSKVLGIETQVFLHAGEKQETFQKELMECWKKEGGCPGQRWGGTWLQASAWLSPGHSKDKGVTGGTQDPGAKERREALVQAPGKKG